MNTCDILIVDDDELYLGLVKRIVEGAGVKARYATSGEEAAAILKEGFFGTLITDLQMPGMCGFELALAAKGVHPEIYIVMVTGSKSPGIERLAREAGISKVMDKPISAAKVREIVGCRPGAAQREAADDYAFLNPAPHCRRSTP